MRVKPTVMQNSNVALCCAAVFGKYIGGQPARDFLYLTEQKAERLFYFDQYPQA